MPETLIAEGYGVASPILGIVMAAPFVHDFEPGGSPPLTVKRKLLVAVRAPSLTITLIVLVPVCPTAGVSVTVRLLPLPPKAMFAFGTRTGLEDSPLKTRFAAGV